MYMESYVHSKLAINRHKTGSRHGEQTLMYNVHVLSHNGLRKIIITFCIWFSQREFTTGEDHTTEVHDIEKNLIGYQNSSVSVCVCVCVCVCERERERESEERRGGGRGREGEREGGGRKTQRVCVCPILTPMRKSLPSHPNRDWPPPSGG